MDLEFIKRLNTPHFCQWYLKRLQSILEEEKQADYSCMPCESFNDLSKIIEYSQLLGKWNQRVRKWVLTRKFVLTDSLYCHARIAGSADTYETRELTEDFIESYGIGIVPFFTGHIKEYQAPDGASLHDYFSAIKPVLSSDEFDSIMQRVATGDTRKSIARYIHVDLKVSKKVRSFVLDTFEPPYYVFEAEQWSHDGFLNKVYGKKSLILPNKNLQKKAKKAKKVLTPPAKSVEYLTVETKQEGNKMMSTIKETAIKSSHQNSYRSGWCRWY